MTPRPKGDITRKQTGVRLRPEVYRAIQHAAIDEGLTGSAMIEKALIDFLQRRGVTIPAEPSND